jgi:hypothetical protein
LELRTIILKSKVFIGWKKKTIKYRNVKEYIIHRLCVQKMQSKVKIFTSLKTNWKAKKEANR